MGLNGTGTRNGAIDVLRLVSAMGIVWFHAKAPGALVAYAGLSVFLFLATALPVLCDRGEPLSAIVTGRLHRLIRPWLIWSAIYGVLKMGEAAVEHRPLLSEFHASYVLTGTSLHLWYLPYATLAGVLAVIVARRLRGAASVRLLLSGIALLSVPFGLFLLGQVNSIPLAQWAHALGPVLLGFAIGLGGVRRTPTGAPLGFAVLGVGLLAAVLWWTGQPTARFLMSSSVILLGSALATLALAHPVPATAWMTYLGELAMPVYLLHPAFLSVMEKCCDAGSGVDASAAIVASAGVGIVMLASSRLRALL